MEDAYISCASLYIYNLLKLTIHSKFITFSCKWLFTRWKQFLLNENLKYQLIVEIDNFMKFYEIAKYFKPIVRSLHLQVV